ncbi:MAG TPA: DNA/RNA non-specific endonuclease [Flavobacteriales bacterium]|jgi:endonuclease G|nr:DNA/RNA non-specific endonuclease [Flavobacteriales bacterium]
MLFRSFIGYLSLALTTTAFAQGDPDAQLKQLQAQYDALEAQQKELLGPLEQAKLAVMRRDLVQAYPALAAGDQVTVHAGHALVWDDAHHVPKWTAHLVMPDILKGNLARIDTFLPDPDVKGNTALYYDYLNSGYDRGHMVPSADMRWSQEALKATYYYSNISPQAPDLNRGAWAELEDWVRRYVHFANERVYVITGPVLSSGMGLLNKPTAKDDVSVPPLFFKVLADLDGPEKKGIAFLMKNGLEDHMVITYAVPIDSVEKLTGLDLFPAVDDATEKAIEAMRDPQAWYGKGDPFIGEVEPMKAPLPGGRFSTTQARYHVGQEVTVCGTVVSTRRTAKANALYLNMDRTHPHQDFYATIWDYNGPNFHYDPETFLVNKQVCVTGKVSLFDDIPRISVNNEQAITFWDDIVPK